MDNFSISPEECLILKAFKDSDSLREAARKLGADPAGLTRKVQQISNQYGFIQKVNNRWQVTTRGLDMVAWVESCIQSQKKILHSKSEIRLASTMWFSEEVLIPNLKSLKELVGESWNLNLSVPNKGFELSLIDGSVDFVVVCHPPENPEIEHRVIAAEEWILVAPRSWKNYLKDQSGNSFRALEKKPFIRHSEMNPDLFLTGVTHLVESGIRIDNLIGVRSAVSEGLGWSLVPRLLAGRYLVQERLMEVPSEDLVRDRKICLWWLRNRSESKKQANKIAAWLKQGLNS